MSSSFGKRSHHRYLHVPRLTGFRRPSQSAATNHGTPQLVEEAEPEESLRQPQHYHAYNDTMSTQRPQQRQNRVRFASDPEPAQAHHKRTHSSSAASSGTGNTHSNPVSTSSSRTSFDLELTSPVAEWCHQMHVMQERRYDWCQACYPRPVQPAQQPEAEEVTMAMIEARRAQMVERMRRERQAAHAYQ